MSPLPNAVQAQVSISWDGTASFTGPYDRVDQDIVAEPGLDLVGGRDGAQQLSPPRVSAGSFELINESGRYSQERSDSPLYQRVEPNKPVRYGGTVGYLRTWDSPDAWDNGGIWDCFLSWSLGSQMIDEIEERADFGDRRVKISTIGVETVLTRAPVTVALMTNPRVDQCITAILDAAGWPAGARAIDVSDTTLLYWWCDARNPWDALLELLASEGPGMFGVDRDGVFVFESRNHRGTAPRSTTSQATLYDRQVSGAFWFTSLSYNPEFRNIFNRATYPTRRRQTGTLQQIWQYGATLTLGASQSVTLFVRPTDPFVGAIAPVAGTDYTVSAGTATVALTYTSGFLAIVVVTAGAGGATVVGVTSTGIQLRAQPLTVLSETTVVNNVDASASIARYSPIPGQNIPLTLAIAGWPEIDPLFGQAVCNAWVLRQQWPRPTITFTMTNADEATVNRMLTLRESDRLTLVQAHSGLNFDVWANSLDLKVYGFNGARAELVLGCEKVDILTGAVWNTAVWNNAQALWGV